MLVPLLLGLAGSLHCVGMCGAIALAVPPPPGAVRWAILGNGILYNLGRITTYTLLGILFGTIGKAVWVAGLQQIMVVLSGIFMLFMAFYAYKMERIAIHIPILGDMFRRVADAMRPLLLQPSYSNAYTIGLLNGLIPCGLVYTAIFSSMTTEGPLEGALFMAAFGFGTAPLMLSLSVGGQFLRRYVKGSWRGLQPLLLCIVGLVAIWRGLNLDVDFFLSIVPKAEYQCH